jgi:hypothetical protein
MQLDRSKDMSVHVSTCTSGSCDADKTCVILRFVAKMIDQYLEQRINIKCSVKFGKLSVETKCGASNMIPRANDKVCNVNSR